MFMFFLNCVAINAMYIAAFSKGQGKFGHNI